MSMDVVIAGPMVGAYHLMFGQNRAAAELVKRYHYSRRVPGSIVLVATLHQTGGLFGFSGRAVAAIIYGISANKWAQPTIELSRLVRVDDAAVSLSGLIAASLRQLPAMGHELVVSYADPEQGHHGGIYQAASWNFHGRREARVIGIIVDGIKMHGRSSHHRWGTSSPSVLTERLGRPILPWADEGKYLYWKALTKDGARQAARLGLQRNPYPKPDREQAVRP